MDESAIRAVSKLGNEAQKTYRALLDGPPEKRQELLGRFYPTQSGRAVMRWNGHEFRTPEEVAAYLQGLPPTNHSVKSVDVQPLPGADKADSFVVTCSGSVVYNGEHTRYFHQRLVFFSCPQTGRLLIADDYYRWTGEQL